MPMVPLFLSPIGKSHLPGRQSQHVPTHTFPPLWPRHQHVDVRITCLVELVFREGWVRRSTELLTLTARIEIQDIWEDWY